MPRVHCSVIGNTIVWYYRALAAEIRPEDPQRQVSDGKHPADTLGVIVTPAQLSCLKLDSSTNGSSYVYSKAVWFPSLPLSDERPYSTVIPLPKTSTSQTSILTVWQVATARLVVGATVVTKSVGALLAVYVIRSHLIYLTANQNPPWWTITLMVAAVGFPLSRV